MMELETLNAKLEELGKILLAEDGFLAQVPKEQLDVFGEAIKLMARIQALEVLKETMGNGFVAKITPMEAGNVAPVAVMEPISTVEPMMMNIPCPKCMSMPCMCIGDMYYGSKDGMVGDMPCPKCMMNPCMCAANVEPMPTMDATMTDMYYGSKDGMVGDMPMDNPEDIK